MQRGAATGHDERGASSVTSAERFPLLVGLDGGATSAKACLVERGARGLVAAAEPVEEVYQRVEAFAPVARDDARKRPYPAAERLVALAWVEAAARAVVGALEPASLRIRPVLLGVALPGLKTPDKRGLYWARHGPRIPDYLARLELELTSLGIELAAPIAGLYSDGDCCGCGEELAVDGQFRGVANAWYAGGGTGLAEAFKVRGEAVDLDELAPAVSKAWEIAWRGGLAFEDALSMSRLNERAGGLIEHVRKEDRARAALSESMQALADLAARRAEEFERAGWGALERVVVGQRLGLMLDSPDFVVEREDLALALAERGLPREGWLVCSRLREAPALGAAARALRAWERGRR